MYAERVNKQEESNERLRDSFLDMVDPMRPFIAQLKEIDRLIALYPEHADQLREAGNKVWEAATKAMERSGEVASEQSDLMKDLVSAAEGYGQQMSSAFVDWISGAKSSFSDMVRSMLIDIAKLLMYRSVFKPMTSGILGLFGFNNGGVFEGGSPTAYANGLVSSPTIFPMANDGLGLAGESGTEAIMPLRRDANGRLGVSAAGGGGINANININISDVRAQDAPAISRAAQEGVGKAVRGIVQSEIFNGMRTGNALNPLPLRGF